VRKLATVRNVSELKPIEGADFIEVAVVDGWNCIVKKGEFQPNDKCIYMEIDSFLPMEDRYEFLRKSSYKRYTTPAEDRRNEGFKLRTMKLRGVISQGLALPLSEFPELVNTEIDTDVTDTLHIELFDPPVPARLAGKAKGNWPGFLQKTDQERIQNLAKYFTLYEGVPFECTEKLDGSSLTAFNHDGLFGVCSRNLELIEDPENLYWNTVLKNDIREKIRDMEVAIQGEMVGPGIQNNRPNLSDVDLYVFDIYDIRARRYVLPDERRELTEYLKLKHVPVIHESINIFDEKPSMEELILYADGKSALNNSKKREGLVYKSYHHDIKTKNTISFKAISNSYLLSGD
jgi:RNA ligase (TIGR02306 family)